MTLSGDISSVAHESILRQRALTLFPQKTKFFDFREQPALPPGWALVSELALRAVAQTYSSRTEITPSLIHIRGITDSTAPWRDGVARLEEYLLPDMRLEHELSEINLRGSLNRQCISLFRTALRGRKINFSRAEATLVTSVAPLLDELVQIAADCPAAGITITGHTDNTGDESGNLELSKARADAVASYMRFRGIATERLGVAGVGSSQPLVSEDTPQAFKLNRRIDIELVFPERR